MKTLILSALMATAALAQGQIQVTDSQGQILTLEQPVKRIISLSASTTESLFDIGAGELIIGASSYSNYPEQAKEIERVSDYYGVNLERVQELNPDLIVLWRDGGSAEHITKLKELGFKVFYVDPNNLNEIADMMEALGQLTGHQQEAQKAANQVRAFIKSKKTQVKNSGVRVLGQVWHDPIYVIEPKGFIDSVVSLCGGVNVLADVSVTNPQVSQEAIIERAPEVILSISSDDSGLAIWRSFNSIPAVKNERMHWISSDDLARPTMSLMKGTDQVCRYLQESK